MDLFLCEQTSCLSPEIKSQQCGTTLFHARAPMPVTLNYMALFSSRHLPQPILFMSLPLNRMSTPRGQCLHPCQPVSASAYNMIISAQTSRVNCNVEPLCKTSALSVIYNLPFIWWQLQPTCRNPGNKLGDTRENMGQDNRIEFWSLLSNNYTFLIE